MWSNDPNSFPWASPSLIPEPHLLVEADTAAEKEAEDISTTYLNTQELIEFLFFQSIRWYKSRNGTNPHVSILTSFYLLRVAGYLRETLGEEGDPGDWLDTMETEAEIWLRDMHSLTEDDLLKIGEMSNLDFHLRHHKIVHHTTTTVEAIR